MYLFFDTETTGLPKDYKAPASDIDNWPRLVQIAWILTDEERNILEAKEFIIKPNGFTIEDGAANVHGITTEKALEVGVDLLDVLVEFNKAIDSCDYIIAHNISFDEKIVGAEFIRNRVNSNFGHKTKMCTMHSSTDYCKLPGFYGKYKWPKLAELHVKLFGKDFEGAHDAMADIEATERCFWELRKLELI
jgi:DNA polymerase III epsilon subunit-like protein